MAHWKPDFQKSVLALQLWVLGVELTEASDFAC